jgi:hypothetical protein
MSAENDKSSAREHPVARAKARTEGVKSKLDVAGADLELTNTMLDRGLPPSQKQGDVAKALEQNEVIQETVVEAAGELHEVRELLEEEIAERHRLERELTKRQAS